MFFLQSRRDSCAFPANALRDEAKPAVPHLFVVLNYFRKLVQLGKTGRKLMRSTLEYLSPKVQWHFAFGNPEFSYLTLSPWSRSEFLTFLTIPKKCTSLHLPVRGDISYPSHHFFKKKNTMKSAVREVKCHPISSAFTLAFHRNDLCRVDLHPHEERRVAGVGLAQVSEKFTGACLVHQGGTFYLPDSTFHGIFLLETVL